MRTRVARLLFAVVTLLAGFAAVSASGQPQAENPASWTLQRYYTGTKDIVLRAAEKMPEQHYSFRPVPEVRTFGEIVAHVAWTNFNLCSMVKGEANPMAQQNFEKTKKTKAEIAAALQASFAYCDPAFAALKDSDLGEARTMFGNAVNKAVPATQSFAHMNKHYGNLITYMRMKGIVPPSSE